MNQILNIKLDGIDVHFGAITDGIRKIEFHLFEMTNVPDIEVGTKIQLSGDLELSSTLITFKILSNFIIKFFCISNDV